jgi:hypothetical protein
MKYMKKMLIMDSLERNDNEIINEMSHSLFCAHPIGICVSLLNELLVALFPRQDWPAVYANL